MSRMFKSIDKTWPVFVGCEFECTYCNARKLALTRLKYNPRYKDGFNPHLVESELDRRFKPGEFVFVAYMGDISFASQYEVERIRDRIIQFPDTNFLICTKNPAQLWTWQLSFPQHVYLGTTIETNRDYHLTKAPPPIYRFQNFKYIAFNHKFLSIEPIQDFDLTTLISWVRIIKPEIVEIGYDNYANRLVEPKLAKTLELIERLEQFTKVQRKTIRKAWNE